MKPVYKEKYPHLFEPMYVGKNKVRFNNRVLVGPIGSGATGGGEDSDGRINTFGIDYWMRYIQGGFAAANVLAGSDGMVICVTGNADRIQVMALFDNLGKGASGAAVQNLNIIMGADEATGLVPLP